MVNSAPVPTVPCEILVHCRSLPTWSWPRLETWKESINQKFPIDLIVLESHHRSSMIPGQAGLGIDSLLGLDEEKNCTPLPIIRSTQNEGRDRESFPDQRDGYLFEDEDHREAKKRKILSIAGGVVDGNFPGRKCQPDDVGRL